MRKSIEPGGGVAAPPKLGLRSTAALPFLESVPAGAAQLKEPNTKDRKFIERRSSRREEAHFKGGKENAERRVRAS